MAIKFDFNREAFAELNQQVADDVINPMIDRIVANANAASSWGAYGAWNGDYVGRAYVLQGLKDTERGRRLLALMNQEKT